MQYYMEIDTNTHDTCIAYIHIYTVPYIGILNILLVIFRGLVNFQGGNCGGICGFPTEVNDFDVVIVDEVHERHLVVDFVLGILREAWGKLGGSSRLRLGRR